MLLIAEHVSMTSELRSPIATYIADTFIFLPYCGTNKQKIITTRRKI